MAGRWSCSLCLLATIVVQVALAQESLTTNICTDKKPCGDCITAGPHCGWCTQDGYDKDNKPRCDMIQNLVAHRCDDSFIIKPEHKLHYDLNVPPRNAESNQDAVQLSPQEVTVKIKPNTPFTLPVTFHQAENYPVDLYYVMDLSNSMADDKEKLATLGELLSERMSQITENFRLGFGSFVDKKTMPYVSTVPSKLIKPCDVCKVDDPDDCVPCASPYGFQNQMSLSENTDQFKSKVEQAPVSGNLDSPEGGLDAIMQAISCKEDIGWRTSSRKMLLFSTDAGFHYAGDGKLGGIVKPNDGECHLDRQGYYTESVNQDYPSIGHLANKIKQKNVNVIFAITKNQVPVYEKLGNFIEGSSVGELEDDSRNIVELVQENYNKISSVVELKVEGADPEDIHVTFRAKCPGQDMQDTASCKGLGIGQNVTYEVLIDVKKCPADRRDLKTYFDIYPVGLTEKLRVNLELICECECEKPRFEERFSPKCNGTGTFECGACTCPDERYGTYCECDATNLQSDDYDSVCKMTNDSHVCQGQGECVCGICDCYPITPGKDIRKYSGKFCECDDYSCDYYNNMLCGGPNRGDCVCGECICNTRYTGKACECPISNESCMASNGLMCNGKGTCECGRCICSDPIYRGIACEDCPTCAGECENNKACVQCTAFQSGELTQEECEEQCGFVEVVDHVEESDLRKLCQFRDDDDCIFYFTYEYDSVRVQAQRTKECPKPVNILAIVLPILLGIILIGLALLLIWKLLVTIHDRREYAKFEEHAQTAKWDMGENPIYKQATSTFKNPTYGN